MNTVLLLLLSNTFMTVAWYGHLKFKTAPLILVILVSWCIALPEYIFQVPANRLGYGQFTATQLKILQEVISISVFLVFGFFYLNEKPTWRTGLAFLLILAAVWLALSDRSNVAESPPPPEGSETNVSR
jgi:uncharacterized protein (DUF486 family)